MDTAHPLESQNVTSNLSSQLSRNLKHLQTHSRSSSEPKKNSYIIHHAYIQLSPHSKRPSMYNNSLSPLRPLSPEIKNNIYTTPFPPSQPQPSLYTHTQNPINQSTTKKPPHNPHPHPTLPGPHPQHARQHGAQVPKRRAAQVAR